MRAITFKKPGGPEVLAIEERPVPEPRDGSVVIKVKAFGLNRAETYFRSGKWPTPVNTTGIECVGEVVADPSGHFAEGQKVAAIMVGMGRIIDGTYAEYVRTPSTNVLPVASRLASMTTSAPCAAARTLRHAHVHGDDRIRPHQLRDLHRVQAEPARPDHRDRLTWLHPRDVDQGVEGRRDRVGHDRADLERDTLGQCAEIARGHDDVLGEPTFLVDPDQAAGGT